MNGFSKQAENFCKKHDVKINAEHIGYKKHFSDDVIERHVFKVTIKKGVKSFSFEFGQSIANSSKNPTNYAILACLTKSDPGNFDDFCSDFGYNRDSISALKTYRAVKKEWKKVNDIFCDCLDELSEIN
jgi:hypothetical protein